MRLLRVEENLEAIREAQAFARERGEVSKEYGDIYREAQAVEVVRRAMCMPDEVDRPDGTKFYRPLFISSEQLRQSFTENEMAICLNAYELVKAQFRCVKSFDPEEINNWAARLSDTLLGPFSLSQLDSSHWPALIMALASRVRVLSDQIGQPLPSSLDSTESDPENSGNTIGGSTSAPYVSLSDSSGNSVPNEKLLTRAEADEIVKKRRK
jgi:hypothetical protein